MLDILSTVWRCPANARCEVLNICNNVFRYSINPFDATVDSYILNILRIIDSEYSVNARFRYSGNQAYSLLG
jgi:hypothetical protein